MEFKKCVRCGCFFMSNDDVCCNCSSKDSFDIQKLNNFIDSDNSFNSIQELSSNTGVTIKNISRFIEKSSISGLDFDCK